jgi:hypothetical protein
MNTPKHGGAFGQLGDVVLVAEHGVAIATRIAKLRRDGHSVRILLQDASEDAVAFRERVASTLRSLGEAPFATYFVASEPIGPRLLAIVRIIVAALPRGARVVLCAGVPSTSATRALAALAMSVGEMARDVDISVDGCGSAPLDSRPEAWRRHIDRTLYRLLKQPTLMQTA